MKPKRITFKIIINTKTSTMFSVSLVPIAPVPGRCLLLSSYMYVTSVHSEKKKKKKKKKKKHVYVQFGIFKSIFSFKNSVCEIA